MTPDKSILRKEYLARRQSIGAGEAARMAEAIAQNARPLLAGAQVVAGYAAVRGEVPVEGLLHALPCIGADKTLVFRAWKPGEPLRKNAYGIDEPLASAATVKPDVLLVPLLAFDRRGHRLGYGAGYYDRTLAALPGIKAIGIAYAMQEAPELPHEAHDQRLDAVVTERGIIRP